MEALAELPALEPCPPEQAISREEEGLLWQSLERVPETYREPLILYYREQESIERVALALELSEEAVRQRLVRGRKLLQEQVLALVEGTLKKTSPGRKFTLGVLAALPATATTSKAAALGAGLVTGGAAAKSAATLGALGGLAGLFAMLGAAYTSLRAEADDTKSPRERRFFQQMVGVRMGVFFLFFIAWFSLTNRGSFQTPFARDISGSALVFFVYAVGMGLFAYGSRRRRQIQMEDKTFLAAEWTTPRQGTDIQANAPGTNENRHLKALKFKAFGAVLTVIVILQAPWKQHVGEALWLSGGCGLALYLSLVVWQRLPRYLSLRQSWVMWVPVVMGLMTLICFNVRQYQMHAAAGLAAPASPAEVMGFNITAGLAYALFIAVLAWKRKNEIRSGR